MSHSREWRVCFSSVTIKRDMDKAIYTKVLTEWYLFMTVCENCGRGDNIREECGGGEDSASKRSVE